ncbi:hypothetical protein DFH07DRAFT_843705 [Mycena maculata]|uniref:F-box domain-containing protein n=1 Tax=Mycena maculata TaxID=230809 RepID=A0AAD7MVX5_9AGAR|nr:hypothetical protein DFH07DRAFT_843705 [Mycena maculata]
MPRPDLPQEVIDAILEDVPDSSLGACSLTATAFVTSSQRRLFRWMSLRNLSAYERTARLLASSPHLGPYFRYLALSITDIPKDYPVLKSILALLNELEYLSISGNANGPTWNQIGQNPALIDLLSRPTLRCFALHHLSGVPSSVILRALSSCKEVLLSHLSITDESQDAEVAPPTELWHFGVTSDAYGRHGILPFVLHPTRVGYLRRLRRLSVVLPPIPEELMDSFMALLIACSSTLEHLEIELTEALVIDNLPTFPALRVLELWIDVEAAKTPTTLNAIVAGTTAAMPHLEALTIALLDRPPRNPQRHQWTGRRPWAWADLDSTFVDMPDALRQVTLALLYFDKDPERYAAFVAYMQDNLPRAFDAGLLAFVYHPSFTHAMDRFSEDSNVA